MNEALFSSKSMEWRTPPELFERLNDEFKFTLDAASNDQNALCEKHFTQCDDGLEQSWDGEIVFCNPPYGRQIKYWVEKCYMESLKQNTKCVMLIPCRPDTQYFHDFIIGKAKEIRLIKGRIKFWNNDGEMDAGAPFPSMVVVYDGIQNQTRFISWDMN